MSIAIKAKANIAIKHKAAAPIEQPTITIRRRTEPESERILSLFYNKAGSNIKEFGIYDIEHNFAFLTYEQLYKKQIENNSFFYLTWKYIKENEIINDDSALNTYFFTLSDEQQTRLKDWYKEQMKKYGCR